MSRKRPTLQDVQRLYPQDLSRCAGYLWHLGSRIGKGSFGEVYLGWTTDGKEEVAVKAVSKAYFKQDPKVRENLEREIRIMKHLRNCEYVVHLNHVQDMKQHIVLVMELCEYDLDYLVKIAPFREDDITLFLFQLAQGMKALRDQNIVHRDLKPGNILIKKDLNTGKMKIKLADFGFARHFTEEGTKKPVDMSSLAGTPVFMAPEALKCVFYPGEHYDDKVDIWSIGALLYKVIVGVCGFYAQLQDILKILKHKKDAIAFERVSHNRSVNYINELPASVYDRFSANYRRKMNTLLVHMLKIDPQERMTFPEFFEFVEDLVNSKIEVVNLLHGTSTKIIYDTGMTVERLKNEVHAQLGVSLSHQLLFSPSSPLSLSPHSQLSQEQFAELMRHCGATKGNGMLYLLPISDVQSSEGPVDLKCLAQLKYAVTNERQCVELIKERKYTKDIIYSINLLQIQRKKQVTGIEEFSKFCVQELSAFKSRHGYQEVYSSGLRAAAQASLAAEWLGADVERVGVSGPQVEEAQCLLRTLKQLKIDLNKQVSELETLHYSSEQQLLHRAEAVGQKSPVAVETADVTSLVREAKKLPDMRQVEILSHCKGILKKCEDILQQSGVKVRRELQRLLSSLTEVWRMKETSQQLSGTCGRLEETLGGQVPCVRTSLLALCSGGATPSTLLAAAPVPPVVVSPPDWTRPPPSGPWPPTYTHQTQQAWQDTAHTQGPVLVTEGGGAASSKEVTALKAERDQLESLFNGKAQECADMASENRALRVQLKSRQRGSSTSEEERTLSPGQMLRPSTPTEERTLRMSLGTEEVRVLDTLREQLQVFCAVADKLKPGIVASDRPRSQTSPSQKSRSPALYPALGGEGGEEYSIISMPLGTERQNSEGGMDHVGPPDSVPLLIPHAKQLLGALKEGIKDMSHAVEDSTTGEKTFIKIAKPKDYDCGDIVLFHPVKFNYTKVLAPVLMHAERPHPYILMDLESYKSFGIRPGKIPDLLVARLEEAPRKFKFDDEPTMARDLNQPAGEFFRVKAAMTSFKFSPQKAPYRPPPPNRLKAAADFMRIGKDRNV